MTLLKYDSRAELAEVVCARPVFERYKSFQCHSSSAAKTLQPETSLVESIEKVYGQPVAESVRFEKRPESEHAWTTSKTAVANFQNTRLETDRWVGEFRLSISGATPSSASRTIVIHKLSIDVEPISGCTPWPSTNAETKCCWREVRARLPRAGRDLHPFEPLAQIIQTFHCVQT